MPLEEPPWPDDGTGMGREWPLAGERAPEGVTGVMGMPELVGIMGGLVLGEILKGAM